MGTGSVTYTTCCGVEGEGGEESESAAAVRRRSGGAAGVAVWCTSAKRPGSSAGVGARHLDGLGPRQSAAGQPGREDDQTGPHAASTAPTGHRTDMRLRSREKQGAGCLGSTGGRKLLSWPPTSSEPSPHHLQHGKPATLFSSLLPERLRPFSGLPTNTREAAASHHVVRDGCSRRQTVRTVPSRSSPQQQLAAGW